MSEKELPVVTAHINEDGEAEFNLIGHAKPEVFRTPLHFTNEELILEALRRIEEKLDGLNEGTTVSSPVTQEEALTSGVWVDALPDVPVVDTDYVRRWQELIAKNEMEEILKRLPAKEVRKIKEELTGEEVEPEPVLTVKQWEALHKLAEGDNK